MDLEAKAHEKVHNAFDAGERFIQHLREMSLTEYAIKSAALALFGAAAIAIATDRIPEDPAHHEPVPAEQQVDTTDSGIDCLPFPPGEIIKLIAAEADTAQICDAVV